MAVVWQAWRAAWCKRWLRQEERRRRKSVGGERVGVMMAPGGWTTYCGGAGGGEAGGGWNNGDGWWWPKATVEREEQLLRTRERWFFPNFGYQSLLSQVMKSTSIYRRWKRTILSILGGNSALDSVGKDPNRWLKVVMVHYQICTYRLPELAFLVWRWSRCVVIRSEWTIPRGRGMLGDHLRVSFVKFDGGYKH